MSYSSNRVTQQVFDRLRYFVRKSQLNRTRLMCCVIRYAAVHNFTSVVCLLTILMKVNIKRIFHGVMVRIGKVEPEGRAVRSGPDLSKVQITGLSEG